MRKTFSNALLLLGGLLFSCGLASCDATFHDSLDKCRNVLLVTLDNGGCDAVTGATTRRHSASSVNTDKTISTENAATSVRAAHHHQGYLAPAGKTLLLAFDNKGLLAADTLLQLSQSAAVKQVPLTVDAGNYTVVVWTGINDAQWEVAKLQRGKTRITDALLTNRAAADTLLAAGSNTTFINLPNATQTGTHTQEVKVAMQRTNFNITADIEVGAETFDALDDLTADSFDIEVKTNFTALSVDGTPQIMTSTYTVPVTKEAITKSTQENGKVVKTVLRTHFVVPVLTAKNSKVMLTLINKGGEGSRIIEKGTFDLLALLHLQSGENGAVNNVAGASHFDPQCDRSAKLRFRLSDRCLSCGEYACYQVWAGDLPLLRFQGANR